MKKTLCLLGLLFTFSSSNLIAQKNTISGYVEDAKTGERMVGVNVVAKEVSLGSTSNTYGFYSMTLPVSSYTLEFSFIGYETFSISVDLSKDAHYNISLKTQSLELQETHYLPPKTVYFSPNHLYSLYNPSYNKYFLSLSIPNFLQNFLYFYLLYQVLYYSLFFLFLNFLYQTNTLHYQ